MKLQQCAMTMIVVMMKIKGGSFDGSLVSVFVFVSWVAILIFRHSTTRTLPMLGCTITSGYHNNYPSRCHLYTSAFCDLRVFARGRPYFDAG